MAENGLGSTRLSRDELLEITTALAADERALNDARKQICAEAADLASHLKGLEAGKAEIGKELDISFRQREVISYLLQAQRLVESIDYYSRPYTADIHPRVIRDALLSVLVNVSIQVAANSQVRQDLFSALESEGNYGNHRASNRIAVKNETDSCRISFLRPTKGVVIGYYPKRDTEALGALHEMAAQPRKVDAQTPISPYFYGLLVGGEPSNVKLYSCTLAPSQNSSASLTIFDPEPRLRIPIERSMLDVLQNGRVITPKPVSTRRA